MKTIQILSKREDEIARCYAQGMIGKEIADRLKISYNTVINHTQSIYDKANIKRSTNALVAWWLTMNFDISFDITPLKRRVVAGVLLMIFAIDIIGNVEVVRRYRPRARRSEYEQIIN